MVNPSAVNPSMRSARLSGGSTAPAPARGPGGPGGPARNTGKSSVTIRLGAPAPARPKRVTTPVHRDPTLVAPLRVVSATRAVATLTSTAKNTRGSASTAIVEDPLADVRAAAPPPSPAEAAALSLRLPAAIVFTIVEAVGLRAEDSLSQTSDPFVICSLINHLDLGPTPVLGRTHVVNNDALHPVWNYTFTWSVPAELSLADPVMFSFMVRDADVFSSDFLGETFWTLQEILGSVRAVDDAQQGDGKKDLGHVEKGALAVDGTRGTLTIRWKLMHHASTTGAASELRALETERLVNALWARQEAVAETVEHWLGKAHVQAVPRIGFCASGGGWRALASATAVLDVLSETDAADDVKILDCVSHLFGISGGSWLLFSIMAGTDQQNAMHGTTDSNPWALRQIFDVSKHNYAGLVHSMDEANVRASAQLRESFVSILDDPSRIGAAYILRVITNSMLGSTAVDRWGTFVGNNILGTEKAGLPFDAQLPSVPAMARGALPMCVATCIANDLDNDDYDWLEASPFFLRNQTRHGSIGAPTYSTTNTGSTKVQFSPSDTPKSGTVADWMGICGSAFLFDTRSVLEKIFKTQPTVGENSNLPFDLANVSDSNGNIYGELRDGGIDTNVPVEAAMFDRQFDILIVHDASDGATTPNEFKKAVKNGACTISLPHKRQELQFSGTNRIQVFQTAGGTTIVHVIGLNSPATSLIPRIEAELREDILNLKMDIRTKLRAVLKDEIKRIAKGVPLPRRTRGTSRQQQTLAECESFFDFLARGK